MHFATGPSPGAQTRDVATAEDAGVRFTATIFGGAADSRFTNAYSRSIDPLILFVVVFLARSYFSLRYRVGGGLSDFFVVGVGQVC